MSRPILSVFLPLVLLAFLAGCDGGDDSDAPADAVQIEVELGNWYVRAPIVEVPSGPVVFNAVHLDDHSHAHGDGEDEVGLVHELVVARVNDDGSYDMVARTGELEVGEAESLAVDLETGTYELQCSIVDETSDGAVSHYVEGMVATFTVR